MKKLTLALAVLAVLGLSACTSQSQRQVTQNEQVRFEQSQKGYPDRIAGDREAEQAENARRATMLGAK